MPEAIVIQNVDQPTRHDIIDSLVEELRSSGVKAVQPSHQGQSGHPVVLAGSLLSDLAEAKEQTLGLRGVLERYPATQVPMNDEPVVRIDLNTPDSLEDGRRLLGVPGTT